MNDVALRRPIAITPGEPAGIGPDLLLMLASEGVPWPIIAIADPQMLTQRADQLGLAIRLQVLTANSCARCPDAVQSPSRAGELLVKPIELARVPEPGQADVKNAGALLASLDEAVDGCLMDRYAALVTGPLNKAVINDAGIVFTGHTEYLAARCGGQHPVMMLVGADLRVALVTTHLALRAVSDAITPGLLECTLRTVHSDLQSRFGITAPRILVLGLNPHAGESGHLGREEIDIIIPVLDHLRAEGMDVAGPLPADTAFNPKALRETDVVLAMYHDQGLPVLKHASFGHGVNITLGLPMIRTSVDHGTAYDLAGTGHADPQSLREAISLAANMASQNDQSRT
ncbi:MAG: 4-hydroxythreonine-4-phosphate dehydrogenase [Gammaproteobacteria bacterium]|jgi:4-hydroxythreonine-4-phosphate dehydrogenase